MKVKEVILVVDFSVGVVSSTRKMLCCEVCFLCLDDKSGMVDAREVVIESWYRKGWGLIQVLTQLFDTVYPQLQTQPSGANAYMCSNLYSEGIGN